ncbi:hypothetical protein BKA69DRAFT_168243 [Paraphysoderma sedebokerense]|nr:hypothetical protein BKA69DRAFT_168243 [Paraphysoderma sedebokerense]
MSESDKFVSFTNSHSSTSSTASVISKILKKVRFNFPGAKDNTVSESTNPGGEGDQLETIEPNRGNFNFQMWPESLTTNALSLSTTPPQAIPNTANRQSLEQASSVSSDKSATDGSLKAKSFQSIIRRLRGEDEIKRDYWMPDEAYKECYECRVTFSTFRRKHHCRLCGLIFCYRCASSIISGEPFGFVSPIRVCDYCMKIMNTYSESSTNVYDSEFTSQPPPSPSPSVASVPNIFNSKMFGFNWSGRSRSNSIGTEPPQPQAVPFRAKTVEEGESNLFNKNSDEFQGMIGDSDTSDDDDSEGYNTLRPSNLLNMLPSDLYTSAVRPVTPTESSDDENQLSIRSLPSRIPRPKTDRFVRRDSLTLKQGRKKFDDSLFYQRKRSFNNNAPVRVPSISKSARPLRRQYSSGILSKEFWQRPSESNSVSPTNSTNTTSFKSSISPLPPLSQASSSHFQLLLRQTLIKFQLPDSWFPVMCNLLLDIGTSVQPSVRLGDDIDIRSFIKFKCVAGGVPADSEYVKGTVFTKNLAHKKLPREQKNPRILLLTFGLEYQRVENQFMSIEPVMSQERSHLRHLVNRITSLDPTVILVSRTVSRIALEQLLQNYPNISLAYNVKLKVLSTIARQTNATIVTSIDRLTLPVRPTLGSCEQFRVKTFVSPDIPGGRKTLIYVDGCKPNLGGCIVLRGGTIELLKKVKQASAFLVGVVYGLKCETGLIRDVTGTAECVATTENESTSVSATTGGLVDSFAINFNGPDVGELINLRKEIDHLQRLLAPYENVVLSSSPHVRFTRPYLLVRYRNELIKVIETAKQLEQSENTDSLQQTLSNLTHSAIKQGLNYFLNSPDTLTPFSHQNIVVLYSKSSMQSGLPLSSSSNNSQSNTQQPLQPTFLPCHPPSVVQLQYYSDNDCTVGQFLEEIEFELSASPTLDSKSLSSPATLPSRAESNAGKCLVCQSDIMNHERIYVHGEWKVRVTTQWEIIDPPSGEGYLSALDHPEDIIYLWSSCTKCGYKTGIKRMSEEAYNLSWGKFLELLCYRDPLFMQKLPASSIMNNISGMPCCSDDLLRSHIHFFHIPAPIPITISIQVSPIRLFELSVPPLQLHVSLKHYESWRCSELSDLRGSIMKFYDTLETKIKENMKLLHRVVPAQKVQRVVRQGLDMLKGARIEKLHMLLFLRAKYIESVVSIKLPHNLYPTTVQIPGRIDIVGLNWVKSTLLNKVSDWTADLNAFSTKYLDSPPVAAPTSKNLSTSVPVKSTDTNVAKDDKKGGIASLVKSWINDRFSEEKDDIESDRTLSWRAVMNSRRNEVNAYTGVVSGMSEDITLKGRNIPSPSHKSSIEYEGVSSPSKSTTSQFSYQSKITPLAVPEVNFSPQLGSSPTESQTLTLDALFALDNDILMSKSTLSNAVLPVETGVSRKLSLKHRRQNRPKSTSSTSSTLSQPKRSTHSNKPSLSSIISVQPSPPTHGQPFDYVLSPFGPEELPQSSYYDDGLPLSPTTTFMSVGVVAPVAKAKPNMFLSIPPPSIRPTMIPSPIYPQFQIPDQSSSIRQQGGSKDNTNMESETSYPSSGKVAMPSATIVLSSSPQESSAQALSNPQGNVKSKKQSIMAWSRKPKAPLDQVDENNMELELNTIAVDDTYKHFSVPTPTLQDHIYTYESGHEEGGHWEDKGVHEVSELDENSEEENDEYSKVKVSALKVDDDDDVIDYDTRRNQKTPLVEDLIIENRPKGADLLADAPDDPLMTVASASSSSSGGKISSSRINLVQSPMPIDIPIPTSPTPTPRSIEDSLSKATSQVKGGIVESNNKDQNASTSSKSVTTEQKGMSIMKTITNLLGSDKESKANNLPFESPLSPTEHMFSESLVTIREDEPSSIISFALNTAEYQYQLQNITDPSSYVAQSKQTSKTVSTSSPAKPTLQSRMSDESQSKQKDQTSSSVIDDEESLLTSGKSVGGGQDVWVEDAQAKDENSNSHMKLEFSEGPLRVMCKVFFAEPFATFRKNCGIDAIFVQSLSRCIKWDALGGKSGSSFLKTKDDRFVMKQISRPELDAFMRFAPSYFAYFNQALFNELPTLLAKIFGVYRVGLKNVSTGKSMKIDVLVMENLFYDRKISRIFDLKGSMRNRHVQSTGKENEVLLDENLVEFIFKSPLYIREHSKKLLGASVWNDTLFLSRMNVMDYSLLVGIDEEKQELVVGIVDFIRTFTWDKKLESWVKETVGGKSGKEPTIISPRQYKTRFREAMERYFLLVPDKFCETSDGDSNP